MRDKYELKAIMLDIFQKMFHISEEQLEKIDCDLPLTGKIFRLNAIEMTYLILEIEKVLEIHFEPEDFMNYKMLSINGIIKSISRH